jgi:type I restriction enzyme R subunit
VQLPGFHIGTDFEKGGHVSIHKLRMNNALTAADLGGLERMLAENGLGNSEDIERAKEEAHGLGLFLHSLVGVSPTGPDAIFKFDQVEKLFDTLRAVTASAAAA